MPNDPGPTTWLNPEYGVMNGYLAKLPPNQRVAALDAAARVAVEREKRPRINVPAWNDVIRFGPRELVTPEDFATQRAYERAGQPSPLSQAKQDEIGRRRRQADNMRNSAIPEYAQNYSQIMTAIDNVQDAALTLAVAGRIALYAAGRGFFGATPFLGALLSIVTVLNWLGLGAALLGPLYAWYCQGPRDAVAAGLSLKLSGAFFGALTPKSFRRAGLPTPVPLSRGKGKAETSMWQMPGAKRGKAGTKPRWSQIAPSASEAMQVGQTGADVTGIGIVLGAIMGMIGEIAYSTARAQAGDSGGLRSPTVGHEASKLLAPSLAGLSTGALWHRHLCAKVVASSWQILQAPELVDDETYMLTWTVLYAALEPLQWDFDTIDWPTHLLPLARGPYTPLAPEDALTRGFLQADGHDPDAPGRWPLPGSPRYVEPDTLYRDAAPRIAAGLLSWLERHDGAPACGYVAHISTATTERLWTFLEGSRWFPRWELTANAAVWVSFWKSHRMPSVGDDPVKLLDFWQRAARYVEETGHKYLSPDELDTLAAASGIELIVTVGATANIPFTVGLPHEPGHGHDEDWIIDESVAGARTRLQALLSQTQPPAPPAPRT